MPEHGSLPEEDRAEEERRVEALVSEELLKAAGSGPAAADLSAEVLHLLRQIMRLFDLRSKRLSKQFGLTGPQLVVLRELAGTRGVPIGELARNVSLSQATITDIADRLERRGLVRRIRSDRDRRRVTLEITEQGVATMQNKPTVLRDEFIQQFAGLERWEQLQILAALQRVVTMMKSALS